VVNTFDVNKARIWAAVSIVLMVIGTFGPWARVLFASATGIDYHNGWFVILAAAIAAGALILSWAREMTTEWLPLLSAAMGGVGVVIPLYDGKRHIWGIDGMATGWGLFVSIAASASLIGASFVIHLRQTER
jgi:hypothetical protein